MEPFARGRGRVSRQFVQWKERCLGDLGIGLLGMHNREGAYDINNDVVTRGGVGVEEDAVQHRWPGEFNSRLFAQFASQRRFGRFPDLDSATRKMPPRT